MFWTANVQGACVLSDWVALPWSGQVCDLLFGLWAQMNVLRVMGRLLFI